eukprot:gene24955-30150_t
MPEHKFEVVGASWGRNGTSSLKEALEILGYPCYHMFENMKHGHSRFWSRLADGEKLSFNDVFVTKTTRFTASTDFPASTFWREQLAEYPDAKVILTVRDPERWYQSCLDTIFNFQVSHPRCTLGVRVCLYLGLLSPGMLEMLEKVIFARAIKSNWEKENVIAQYIAHKDAVIREVPADKLLVFEVSEGWEPLCKFLGKPIPSVPFPHVNDTAQFQSIIRKADWGGKAILAAALLLPLCVGYYFYSKL